MEINIFLLPCLFIFSFQSTLDFNIIRDLSFNIPYKENVSTYFDNKLPESTGYYIRFPPNFNKNFKFYLSLAKFTPLFPVYIAEFPHYPNKSELNQTEFTNELYLSKQDDNYYDIYTTNIQCEESYVVIYFKNNVALNYLSLYAETEMIINDTNCNHIYEYENVPERTKLFLRVNIENDSGKEIKIDLNYRDLYNNSAFIIDVGTFDFYPEEEDILSLLVSDLLYKNLSGKVIHNQFNDTHNTTVQYTFRSNDIDKYLIIQIDVINYLEYFRLMITTLSNNKKEESFSAWIIAIISVIAFVIIMAIIIIGARKGNECCQKTLDCCAICCVCCCCCCEICSGIGGDVK